MFFFKKKEKHHYEELREKWVKRHRKIQETLLSKHSFSNYLLDTTRHITIGSATMLALLLHPGSLSGKFMQPASQFQSLDNTTDLILNLSQLLPQEVQPLTGTEEEKITSLLSKKMGFRVTAMLQGIQLERNYGYIGQEQHLMRYPGDSLLAQLPTEEEQRKYYSYGMAPGLGAYGYFATSVSTLTDEDIQREKWYIAVQTFLAPGYNEHVKEYNDFFQYRKMLVVNPDNGKAIVADIADAGPSPWTGKSLGGSPEVMQYLNRVDGAQRGPVLYFFIDDTNNTVPLGPLAYN
ncbi:MAG TPA: hypothetical protein VGT05_01915 [Patescibacteria group bacterium]|nr:hypothetical protein [Patescibacteria group bacterium]